MPHWLLSFSFISAVIEWVAVAKRWRKVEYFAKPGVMVFLLAWMVTSGSLQQANLRWFTAGALFSLLGDVFLLLRRERLGFMLGLVAFLLAHLSYILALCLPRLPLGAHSLFLGLLILSLMLWLGRCILGGLRRKGLRRLVTPIALYILSLSAMLFCALSASFRPDWQPVAAGWVGAGAVLFTISDSLLAWNKFVSPLRYGRLGLMVTYHLGQIAIMIGAVLQFATYDF